mmetsp:Transcript_25321/g.45811  ORF Transcript_25321/g.45811 Transcript_25321/m.45811 type:complete len:577 (+) Transcript_25321:157-1887(+)
MRQSHHLEPRALPSHAGNPQEDIEDGDEEEADETKALLSQAGADRSHSGDYEASSLADVKGPREFLKNLEYHFGYKLLVSLFAIQHALKGFGLSFVQPAVQYLLASYQVTGPQIQVFQGLIGLPWAMKPVIGLMSDAVPLFGFKKGPYMVLVTLSGMSALAIVGRMPHEMLSLRALVFCLFLVHLQCSTCDLLSEALFATKIQAIPKQGPALMTYVWFGIQVGTVMAALFCGPVMQHFGIKAPFLVALVPASLILAPIARGYLEEKQISAEDLSSIRKKLWEQSEACFLCFVMFAGTLVMSFVGITYHNVFVNAATSMAVAVVILLCFSFLLRPEIAKVNAFFVIQTSAAFQVTGASFYFYTDTPLQFKDGPHFSMWFYTSVLNTTGAVFSLVGILLYQRYATEWKYQSLLVVSNLLLSTLSFSDVILFAGLNRHFGIPDKFFVLGASVLTEMVKQWQWMPGIVIISQICPKGMEAIMYSLLAGCHNLGNNVATTGGALVLELLDCRPSGAINETDQFKYLWAASALSCFLPMATVMLIPFLIPDAKQTDRLIQEDEHNATRGSLLRRLMGTDDKR